jgi:hypothetical protein
MPETDIFNPTPIWEEDIQDSMCPDYGLGHKRASTQLKKKAIGGYPWTRETQNIGHSFTLSWNERSYACVRRIKWYYEQYEDGYFTIIDHDGGGRHYVGRFTSEPNLVETGNGMWDVQNLTFEEIPTVPMVKYPDGWDEDAVTFNPQSDIGDQKLATSGIWSVALYSIAGQNVIAMNGAGVANDWAQYEYRGYGYKLFLLKGPHFGQCQVLRDETIIAPEVDCYSAGGVIPAEVLTETNVPLDIHRIKVIELGTKNAAASSTAITWYKLQVMR